MHVPGPARVSQTLAIATPITITGNGRAVSAISAIGDITVVRFLQGAVHPGIRDISVQADMSPSAQWNAIEVQDAVCAHLEHMFVWGGFCGLYDRGVDGLRFDVFFAGANPNGACVSSNGNNFWERCKFDSIPGYPLRWAFYQGNCIPGQLVAENRFTDCDFSGDLAYSFQVNDTNGQAADSGFSGCIFSSPISLYRAYWTHFHGCKFGAAVIPGADRLTIGDSLAHPPFAIGGPPDIHLSNNDGIT